MLGLGLRELEPLRSLPKESLERIRPVSPADRFHPFTQGQLSRQLVRILPDVTSVLEQRVNLLGPPFSRIVQVDVPLRNILLQ